MSTKYLGETFDIHGGGADLTFPHHENEAAQSCCANKGSEYARMWLHNGFLTVNGEKMSKSTGNFTTVRELLDKGIDGEVIRLALLTSHYRKPLDWTDKLLSDSKKIVDSFYRIEGFEEISMPENYQPATIDALKDDLNMSQALSFLYNNIAHYNKTKDATAAERVIRDLRFLGFLNKTADEYFGRKDENAEILKLIAQRKSAKENKDYQKSDQIRQQLLDMGVIIEDKPGGLTQWRLK